jgi:hypothetical protein
MDAMKESERTRTMKGSLWKIVWRSLVSANDEKKGGGRMTRTLEDPVNHPYTISAWCSTTLPPPQRATSWALKPVTWQRVDCPKKYRRHVRKKMCNHRRTHVPDLRTRRFSDCSC